MARINLGGGRWFSTETSQSFGEDTRWNGNNHISVATGSQWAHEMLYRTRSGVWILHSWSQWQGTLPSYEVVSAERARKWLIDNDHSEPLKKFFPEALAEAEL